jgi:glucose-fructose oxidoreductase
LLDSGDIDAVYIALPNDMHREYAIRAARRGVHVLCEKPMALTSRECQDMIEARDEASIKMMIAYRLHFERANLEAARLAGSGRLGELRLFTSTFSFSVKGNNIRTQAERGGGPTYDIGIYCINAARMIFRAEPNEVCAMAVASGDQARFEEIEEAVAVLLRFPQNRLATFMASFGAASAATYRIIGTRGDLLVDNAFEYTEPIRHRLTVNGRTRTKSYSRRDQFAPELLYFSDCILKDRAPEPSAEEGLIDVRIIEAIQKSATNGGRAVELGRLPRDRHPTIAQEIRRPPVKKPPLVNVASASKD